MGGQLPIGVRGEQRGVPGDGRDEAAPRERATEAVHLYYY